MHALSVVVGAGVAGELPTARIDVVAAVAFLAFAAGALRGDELTDADEDRARIGGRSARLAAGVAFFRAELGDKTMLATITLATRYEVMGGPPGGPGPARPWGWWRPMPWRSWLVRRWASGCPSAPVRCVAAGLSVVFGLLLIVDGVHG